VVSRPEQDIAQLETLLRKLEKDYDKFLCGLEREQPWRTENEVLAIVRTYASRPLQNQTLGFKYTSLVARYNSFKTVWSRRLREKEEGRALGAGAPRPGRAAPSPRREQPQPGKTGANPTEYLTSDPRHEQRRMEQFLETYRRMREKCGEPTEKLTAAGFQKALAEKVEKIKREQRCEAVLIRVVSDQGRTRIVAKPFRRQADPGEASS
jgi:hypothetical protein